MVIKGDGIFGEKVPSRHPGRKKFKVKYPF
jgi:hypothetical protein